MNIRFVHKTNVFIDIVPNNLNDVLLLKCIPTTYTHGAITQLSYVLSCDDFDISFYYRVYTFICSKRARLTYKNICTSYRVLFLRNI